MLKIKENVNLNILETLGFLYAVEGHVYTLNGEYIQIKPDWLVAVKTNKSAKAIAKKVPLIFVSSLDRIMHIYLYKDIQGCAKFIQPVLNKLYQLGYIENTEDTNILEISSLDQLVG